MNTPEKLGIGNTNENVVKTKSPLEKGAIEAGTNFIRQVEQITEIPSLDFNPNSLVFVCIPAYRELENVGRLFQSWNSQTLPQGTSIEIVICINQKTEDTEDTEENKKALETLQNLYTQNQKGNIRFHFIDNFSENHRLGKENNIGDIRNILSAAIVKSVLKNPRNGIIFSTDADTFPTDSCAVELQKKFESTQSVYGSVDKKIEFDPSIPEDERVKIKQLFLLNDIHEILLEYFSSRRLTLPESMGAGGAGFFSSIDQFIAVGGYSSMDFGEDTGLLNKLYARKPNGFNPVLTAELTNTIRFSDRLEGDGALLSELRKDGYPANHSVDITQAHAQIRKWFSNSLVSQFSFEQSLSNLNIDELLNFLSEKERNDLKDVAQNKLDGENDDERIENLFRDILKKLYALRKEKIEIAIGSYATFIKSNLGEDEQFQAIFSKNQKDLLTSSDEDIIRAFIEFSSNFEER